MKRMIEITRRITWRFLWRFAMAAGVALGFCSRYLTAPLALDKSPRDENVEGTQTSTQMSAIEQTAGTENDVSQAARSGRLLARPAQVKQTGRRGVLRLGLSTLRDGLIYVPTGYQASRPAPLVLSLHGAGGNANQGLRLLQHHADRSGFILLAVESRRSTWDMLLGGYGPDVEFINRALAHTFSRYAVDPSRIAVAGFSDGASYALSLGITNGDLFKRVIAFSPGFMAPAEQRGKPPVFISHGKKDKVLPIDRCSRRIVPQLQRTGYAVRYREFDGPHTLPKDVSQEAAAWWLHDDSASGR
jgi:predicted esterase